MPIKVLAPEVAAKIAAGEVVERPASVVKELVENSIDAGAATVRVHIREGGRRYLRVEDDGCGIQAAEVPVAFARHATSKLNAIEDLEHIRTLGFRGEALASIAAVSHLTMITRVNPDVAPIHQALPGVAGTRVCAEGGIVTHTGPDSAAPGTAVTVEHLFFNVPARLKFLKAPATESGHIHRVISSYALAYPEVRFELTIDGNVALSTSGSGRLQDALVEVFGLEVAREMIPVGDDAAPARGQVVVSGYTGLPSLHRAQRNQILFFVNRRWIQDRSLNTAMTQAYQTLLPIGRQPVAVVNVEIDPAEVDVNVHPTKSEVKFRDPQAVFGAVQRAVRSAVVAAAGPVEVGLGGSGDSRSTWHHGSAWDAQEWRREQDRWTQTSAFGLEVQRTWAPGEALLGADVESARALPVLRVLGQLAQTYIIAEGPDGLYMVDQHAAHERVLYEQLQAGIASASLPVQRLLEPVTVELTPGQAAVLGAEGDILADLGFDIAHFGGMTYRLSAVPNMLANSDVSRALVDVLDEMAEGAIPLARQADERLKIIVCKRASIKGGQVLSLQEMQTLMAQLERTTSPRTCPHGRPTMVHLSAAQLAREFGRH